MPFRTPGSGLGRRRGFATTVPVFDAFAAHSLLRANGAWAPVHAPPCHGKSRFSEPRRRSLTSATEFDARTHPASRRSSHASEAFAPLHAGIEKCRLRRPLGAFPHHEPASRSLHAPAFTVAFHLRGRSSLRAGALEQRRARALDDCASPSRFAPGTRVTGSTHHPAWTT